MDLDKLKFLNNEQKARFSQLEALFRSDGWELVEEWAKQHRESATANLISANTWEKNRLFTGAREAFGLVENLRAATEAEFEALASANEEAAQVEDETRFE